jgi:hypothetical protein
MKEHEQITSQISRRRSLKLIAGGIAGGWAVIPMMGLQRDHSYAAALLGPDSELFMENEGWTKEWDRVLISTAVKKLDSAYDEKESLLRTRRGPDYNYHTSLRNTSPHQTRESFEYALLLLEEGSEGRRQRALKVLDRDLALQNADPASKYYGLWSYYLEEPLETMSAVDFNWADFNGALLLMIYSRHAARLPEPLRARVREAIRHAAYSVRRREVSPYYTNIAVQGSFVVLAAGDMLADKDLTSYAIARWRRFAQTVDETGSFAEYNSPTYTQVAIENLTRILMVVKNPEILDLSERIHRRAWMHLGKHWHVPTAQLAGPMSRAYSNDIGDPMWLQKALDNRLQFASLAEVKQAAKGGQGQTGVLDFRCPADLRSLFTEMSGPRQHREVFIAGKTLLENISDSPRERAVRPVQGTTYLTPQFALGSANRSDFWVQRRPLLAYWGTKKRPPQSLQLRVVKDDYDFTSALFYSAQNENCVLGAINFRSPGGDKHPSLDPVKNGEFKATRLYAQFLINGWQQGWAMLVDGKQIDPGKIEPGNGRVFPALSRVSVAANSCKFCITTRAVVFGQSKPSLRVKRDGTQVMVELDFAASSSSETIRWSDLGEAFALFTLEFAPGISDLASFDQGSAARAFGSESAEGTITSSWVSAAGKLQISAGTKVQRIVAQDELFDERLNNATIPVERLSNERLISTTASR